MVSLCFREFGYQRGFELTELMHCAVTDVVLRDNLDKTALII